ncbi:isocyanide synthase family protein [Naumannella cuiyingiana]|uniref:Pyoverdine/dityrosine biosynthesis protein Dit1 n=1 Tax=Naumannella cuiyingiana TaxID=1347891 RepID=A0A7Z0IJK5_9ACTN|nr:isocyanide synthase family protein [Naumannella cuiyingiana]NYI69635.1 pyoverdine/dityrosine biosynthesis protein Dit1 [Naumannella cuiyingiana]
MTITRESPITERALRTAERIVQVLLRHRRGIPGEPAPTAAPRPQLIKVLDRVLAGVPIELALPAFPCKSPNPAKVCGPLPDEGERLALSYLQGICDEIADIHPPGARVIICSDGHVFADVVGVPDETVTAYGDHLRALADAEGRTRIGFCDLGDLWPGDDHAERRARLIRGWTEPVDELRVRARSDEQVARTLRGMIRFVLADAVDLTGTPAQRQREAKRRAYQLLARSRAWGALLLARRPDAVRLSIHPQPLGAAKLGIALLDRTATDDAWLTPWHAVVRYDVAGTPRLVHHAAVGDAEPVRRGGRLWCYRDRLAGRNNP